jgi:hypothetical protein
VEEPSRISWVGDKFERLYVVPRKGRTLIVGSKLNPDREDRRKRYSDAVGLDMQEGEGVDLVHDLENPLPGEPFAHVECMSVLEHCRRPWVVAHNIEEAMRKGSTLFLSVPFVWRWHGYPNDYFRFTADGVKSLFPRIEWAHMMYATDKLLRTSHLKVDRDTPHPRLPRCEVLGFGRRV